MCGAVCRKPFRSHHTSRRYLALSVALTLTPSYQQSTKVGQIVGKLRHNETVSEEIRAEASKVVLKWKQAVQAKKPKPNGAMAPTRNSTPSQTASPAPPPSQSNNKPYDGDIEKRDFRSDKIRYQITDSSMRNNSVGLIYNGLAFLTRDSIETVTAKATEVEAAAYKHFAGEGPEYRLKVRSLFQNLKVRSNKELRRRVMTGEIAAADFIKMSQDELKSQEHKERDRAFEKENISNAQVAQPERSISDALQCGKCGEKKVSYSQAQTRSADEPMTTFCLCTHCGNRWKVRPLFAYFGGFLLTPLVLLNAHPIGLGPKSPDLGITVLWSLPWSSV